MLGRLADITFGVFPKCHHCKAQFTVDTEYVRMDRITSALCEICGWGTQLTEVIPSPIEQEDDDDRDADMS